MQLLAEISSLIARHAQVPDTAALMPGLRLLHSNSPTRPSNTVQEPAFALVAQGRKRTAYGKHVMDYGAGDYLVVPLTLPLVGHVMQATEQTPYLAVAMALEPSAIAEMVVQEHS